MTSLETTGPEVILQVEQLTKTYDGNRGITDISFTLRAHDIVGLIGENGAGKTTILSSIAGIIPSASGEIILCGKKVGTSATYYNNLGIAFDEMAFYPELNALDNLHMVTDDSHRITEALKLCGMFTERHKKVSQYSLGMKQRLNIARSIVNEPRLLIMDEPLIGLDPKAVLAFKTYVADLVQKTSGALLISSHALKELIFFCNRYIFLKNGEMYLDIISMNDVVERADAYIQIDREQSDNVVNTFRAQAVDFLLVEKLGRIYFSKEAVVKPIDFLVIDLPPSQNILENIYISILEN